MHLALDRSKTEHRHGSDYSGHMVCDFGRRAELSRQSLHLRVAGATFRYAGGANRHTTSSLNDLAVEMMFGFAEEFDFEAEAVEWVANATAVELTAPEGEDPYWLNMVNESHLRNVGDIANVINSAFDQIRGQGIAALNRCLARVKISQANEQLLVGVLRAVAPHSRSMSNWSSALRETYALLESKNLPAKKILRGLDA